MDGLCIHPFDRLSAGGDEPALLVHEGKLIKLRGWCPACGSLITVDGAKIAPSPSEWKWENGTQTALSPPLG